MKKILSGLLALSMLLSLSIGSTQTAYAAIPSTESAKPVPAENARVQGLVNRLAEIKELDKSGLSNAEKKSLRNETKDIKKELKKSNQGVYLSVGAVIIIILLLILLL